MNIVYPMGIKMHIDCIKNTLKICIYGHGKNALHFSILGIMYGAKSRKIRIG